MIRGAIVKVLNGAVRLFSADGRSENEFENREFFQHYGVSSRPMAGAEVIIIRQGNHFVAIADGDRRYQISLEEGEVAIHDARGQRVHLTRDGIVVESGLITLKGATVVDGHAQVKTGWSGTFHAGAKVITVRNGIIVSGE